MSLNKRCRLCTAKNAGNISKADEDTYYCADGQWHKMTALENMLGLCRDRKTEKIGEYGSKKYYCEKGAWIEIISLE